jgi:hypothetical protein
VNKGILTGLLILKKYEEETSISLGTIKVATFERTIAIMSTSEIEQLKKLGWYLDIESVTWCHNI